MANELLEAVRDTVRTSPLLRLLALGGLLVLLLVPIAWIHGLVGERMARRAEAVDDVSGKWGGAQTIVGPALVVPYEHRWADTNAQGLPVTRRMLRHLTILPAMLTLRVRVDADRRARGIFTVPVYRSRLAFEGVFDPPNLAELRIAPDTVDWSRSVLAVGIADARAIQDRARVHWNGTDHEFLPGAGSLAVKSGIRAAVAEPFAAGQRASFAFTLALNGSTGLRFAPVGQDTEVRVDSDWPSPSFQGHWLPVERETSDTGFTATWRIPFLARNQASAWSSTDDADAIATLERASFGVDLIETIDAHGAAYRSVKYASLFVLLTFALIWLIEVLARVRVHPIQYLLIGCALCTFYLLELSLAEQLGFVTAYVLAATAVAGLVGLYAALILGRWRRAAVVVGTVTMLYAYLYVVLVNEDYALLLGSLGVFLALAVTMLATRHVDWYRIPREPDPGPVAPVSAARAPAPRGA